MRLTERVIDEKGIEHIMTKYVPNNQKLKDEKLCQLEDIEEELGIDLITLFKALKNGIWSKRGDKVEKIEITDNLRLVLDCNGSTNETNWWLLDYYDMNGDRTHSIDNWWVDKYGIEWALTKEELL